MDGLGEHDALAAHAGEQPVDGLLVSPQGERDLCLGAGPARMPLDELDDLRLSGRKSNGAVCRHADSLGAPLAPRPVSHTPTVAGVLRRIALGALVGHAAPRGSPAPLNLACADARHEPRPSAQDLSSGGGPDDEVGRPPPPYVTEGTRRQDCATLHRGSSRAGGTRGAHGFGAWGHRAAGNTPRAANAFFSPCARRIAPAALMPSPAARTPCDWATSLMRRVSDHQRCRPNAGQSWREEPVCVPGDLLGPTLHQKCCPIEGVSRTGGLLGSGLLGSLGSVVKGVLTSKAGLIGLLGAGLAAVLANPELRTMIGNMLGEVGSWLWGKIKEGFSNLPDLISGAWNTLTGQNGGVNQSRALAYDEEGNVTEYVDNSGLKEAVVTAGVANTAQGFRGVSKAVAKAAKKGKSLNIVQKIGQFIKSTSLPGHKVVGNTVKGVGTVGGGIINGVKKLFGIGNNQAGNAAAAAAGVADDAVDIAGAASKVAGEAAEGAADAATGKGGTSFIKKIANKLLGKTDDAAAAAAGAAGKTTTLGGMVKNLVQKGANKLAQTDLGQTLISNAKVLGATAKDNVQSIATKGLDALKGLGSKAVEGVKSIGSKVAGLFKGNADNVAGAAAKAATGAADDVAKAATKSATSNASIVTKALDLIKKGLESAGKSKLGSKFSKVLSSVAKFFDDIIKAVTKKGVASKLISKLCGALSAAGAKVASYLVPGVNILNAVLAAGSAISGALQPERLFKVDDKYVDGKMRVIAAVINGITSATGLGSILSVINEIWTEISGNDFIQGFAITIYHAFADDEDDVGFTAVHDDVVGMEAFIAGIIPLVGAEGGHGVDVHPVAETGSAVDEGTAAVVGVAAHGVAGGFGEAHFLHMIGGLPFPDDFAVPVHFVHDVVEQRLVGDVFAVNVAVAEHEGVAGHGLGFVTGSIVTGGAAFTLEVVMLTGHPLGLFTRILNEFGLVEFPHHVAVPVHLDEVDLVLKAVLGVADAAAAEQITAGENLVREAVNALPELDFLAVHVDEHGALALDGHDGIAVVRLFRIVKGNTGRVNCRMAHDKTPL